VKRQAKKVRNRVPITTHVAGNAIVMRAWYSKVSVPQHTDDVSMLSKTRWFRQASVNPIARRDVSIVARKRRRFGDNFDKQNQVVCLERSGRPCIACIA
jgi:hypothetical protein